MTVSSLTPADEIKNRILIIRSHRVILDTDLALLYDVTTKRLNEQVKRNHERFPGDFMFQLSSEEKQEVVANCDHLKNLKFSRTNPYAFTEHGAIMAASVLNSPQAIEASILIVRTFVKIRQMIASHKELNTKILQVERKLQDHDGAIRSLILTIDELMEEKVSKKIRQIGFSQSSPDKAKK